MSLLLMRHGPTQLNNADTSKDKIRGWLNVPLSNEGHDVAAQLANDAKDYPLVDLHSSDLSRAADTAEAISEKTGIPVVTHPELRPWHLGELSGQSTNSVMPIIKTLVDHPSLAAPKGESFDSFLSRFLPFVTPMLHDDQLHGIVTHIRNIKTLEAFIAGKGELDRQTWDRVPAVDPGGIVYADATQFHPLSKESTNRAGAGS